MSKNFLPMLAVAGALLFLGAACAKKATTNANANVSRSGNVNVINTNTPSNTNTRIINLNASTNTSDESAAPLSATVTITSAGFSPPIVTVRVGGTVTWRNSDAASHQPASDPHPVHTGLPGFDAIGGVDSGQSYAFTFTKAGTFTYHDHPNPTQRGTVIVK